MHKPYIENFAMTEGAFAGDIGLFGGKYRASS